MRIFLACLSVMLCLVLFTGGVGSGGPADDKSASGMQATQSAQDDSDSDASENASSGVSAVLLLLFLLLASRLIVVLSVRSRNKRHPSPYAYRDKPSVKYASVIPERKDDIDYPSGFGGLGNRKAIYGEDVDESDDIGIIQHDYEELTEKVAQYRKRDSGDCDT